MTHDRYCIFTYSTRILTIELAWKHIMNTLLKLTLPFTAAIILSACGSSSSTKPTTAPVKSETPTTPVTPTPVTPEPAAVHSIQPENVAQYIETFKRQYDALDLQINGVKYDISYVDSDRDANVIYAKYDKGYLFFGFDFDNNQPIASLTVLETELDDINDAIAEPTAYFFGTGLNTTSDDSDNIIYSGSINNTTGEYSVRLLINESLLSSGNSSIEVEGDTAKLNGELGSLTYVQLNDLINNQPAVKTLLLQSIGGSLNDDINMHTGRLIRNAQLNTKVEATSKIYSGGVDLYAAGFSRTYTPGAVVGVHSWCCNDAGKSAADLEKDDPAHGPQLTYFREMLGKELGPEFYFFTIDSAAFDSIHEMTQQELDKFLLIK